MPVSVCAVPPNASWSSKKPPTIRFVPSPAMLEISSRPAPPNVAVFYTAPVNVFIREMNRSRPPAEVSMALFHVGVPSNQPAP